MSSEIAIRPSDQHSVAMQIMFDDKMFERVKWLAQQMARADGFIPKHLSGKTEACFAVVTRSMTWGLDPFAVALSTYQTPGGAVGFEGKLCHAILERSNKFNGRIKLEYFGDWSKIQGKFKQRESKKTNKDGKEYSTKYNAPAWREDDEKGLGVKISAIIKGDATATHFEFLLVQAQPRNSTLWATDPKTQLGYLAMRRFANSSVPDIFMGLPFDEEYDPYAVKDVTPAVNEKKERKEATEINDILSAQVGVPVELYQEKASNENAVVESPVDKLAEARASVAAAIVKESAQKESLPTSQSNEPTIIDAARKRMETIRNSILETKTADQLRMLIHGQYSHISMMPDILAQKLYDTIAIQKEKLGIALAEDLFCGEN